MLRLDLLKARRTAVTAVATLLVVAACGSGAATPAPSGLPTPDDDALAVVATTTVFADLVAQVGGTRVAVASLVPKGGEVHTFDPTPSDVQRVTEAKLIVMNGLGLDEWLGDLVADAGSSAPVVELAEDLEGVELLEGGEHHEGEEEPAASGDEHAHEGEEFNPHLWLNVRYVIAYVDRIEEALAAAAPADAGVFATNAEAFRTRLEALDADAASRLGALPAENRVVVSFHEAFPYFAAAYGLEVVGTIVDAPGQDPSAGELADLIAAIRESGAKAIFAEAQFSEDLVDAVAEETGAVVVSDLYNDSLGDAPADTYEGMMRWNIDRIVEALGG